MADQNSENSNNKKTMQVPILEWIVALIGFALVVGTIGFMIYKSFTSKDLPPALTTHIKQIDAIDAGYRVVFKLKNGGDKTASGVVVEGELKNGAEILETSSATFDYVPSKSETEGGMIFKNDPKQFSLEIRAKGYSEP